MTLSFRDLHHQDQAFIIPNPWDVGSARILASFGFPALATTSAGMAYAMGRPEGSVDPDVTLEHCRQIVAATPLPVNADLEYGFGHSPESAADTIRAVATTGVAGCSLEDHTGDTDTPIYDFDLAVDRIAAASEACRALDHDMVFTARCENHLWGRDDLDDTIRRLQAFEAAGADVLYAPGLRDLDSIKTLRDSLSKPINVIMGMPNTTFGMDELSAIGINRVSVGSAAARLAYGSLIKAAQEMTGSGTFHYVDDALGFDTFDDIFKASS